MSDSPFAGIAGVSMTTNGQTPVLPDAAGGAQEAHEAPPQQAQPTPPVRQTPKQQRARASDFGRFAGKPETMTEVAEVGEDASDPFAPLVERSIVGAKGQELARAEPIDAEAEQVARLAAQDAQAQHAEEPVEAQATLVEDDPRTKADPRYKQWKEAFEVMSALAKGGDLPADGDSWLVPMDFGEGRRGRLTIKDLKRGWLREADYHRKLRDVHEMRRSNETWEAGLTQMTQGLCGGDGNLFIQACQLMPGGYETFVKAAMICGFQADAWRRLPPEQRQLAEQNRLIQAENARLQMQMRQLQQQAQQVQAQQPTPTAELFAHQLQQMLPIAEKILAAEGRPYIDSPHTRQIAKDTMDVFIEDFRRNQRELTTDMVVELLRSIMQQAEDIAGRNPYVPAAAQQVPPIARTAPAPSSQIASQAGAPNYGSQNQARPPANGRPQRARLSDIAHINRG